jgi:hypothetical protein
MATRQLSHQAHLLVPSNPGYVVPYKIRKCPQLERVKLLNVRCGSVHLPSIYRRKLFKIIEIEPCRQGTAYAGGNNSTVVMYNAPVESMQQNYADQKEMRMLI